MIVGENFVYIHVPRTAGTTAEDLFRSRHGLEPIHNEQHDIFADLEEEHGKIPKEYCYVRKNDVLF